MNKFEDAHSIHSISVICKAEFENMEKYLNLFAI